MDGVNSLAGAGGPPHGPSVEARVAVLEEIASATKQGMAGLRQDIGELRNETGRRDAGLRQKVHELRNVQERDFRIMFGALITAAIGLAALMAKGFHWF